MCVTQLVKRMLPIKLGIARIWLELVHTTVLNFIIIFLMFIGITFLLLIITTITVIVIFIGIYQIRNHGFNQFFNNFMCQRIFDQTCIIESSPFRSSRLPTHDFARSFFSSQFSVLPFIFCKLTFIFCESTFFSGHSFFFPLQQAISLLQDILNPDLEFFSCTTSSKWVNPFLSTFLSLPWHELL